MTFEEGLDVGQERRHVDVSTRDASRRSSAFGECIPELRVTSRFGQKRSMTNGRKIDIGRLKRILIENTGPGKAWSRRSLSTAAGLGVDGVRDIISGRSGNPKGDTLLGLAQALGKDVSIFFNDEAPTPPLVAEFVEVIGSVAAGVWREQSEWPKADRFQIAVAPSPVPNAQRFALVVEGFSMDLLFAPGTILDCIRAGYGPLQPQAGDLVVAERSSHDLRETTCKRLALADGGGFELRSESTRQEFQEPIPLGSPDRELVTDHSVSVIGIVVGSYQSHFRAKAR